MGKPGLGLGVRKPGVWLGVMMLALSGNVSRSLEVEEESGQRKNDISHDRGRPTTRKERGKEERGKAQLLPNMCNTNGNKFK